MSFSACCKGLLIAVVLTAGCSTPKEVVEVVDRPEPLPSTEEPAPQPEMEPEDPVAGLDVQPGRFDYGKMWTFDSPPLDYFEEAYGFRPDTTWFNRARLGALRFSTYCSASFVSPAGLVLTNHHCARESVTEVSQPGENLLDNGFYASSVDEEREVEDLYVEQLIDITDVTQRVHRASEAVRGDEDKARLRAERAEEIAEEMTAAAKRRDSTLTVQVVELYDGGRYAAYTFRRFEDVRLVMAPEQRLGYFGGDYDNFTYPRYNLDMSLFRVYGPDGQPLQTADFFPWSTTGTEEGAPVFVVGNPGSTSRLNTVSELIFERDYELPAQVEALEARAELYEEYLEEHPEESEARTTYLSITNSLKATRGQLEGLRDSRLIARRAAAEEQFRRQLAATDSLQERYAGLFQDLSELQRSKEAVAARQSAFAFFGTELGSHVLLRALYGYYYDTLKRRMLPAEDLAEIREDALDVEDSPAGLEEKLVAQRLRELQDVFGADDPTLRRILGGQPIDSVAARIVEGTVLLDKKNYEEILDSGYLASGDPTVPLMEALAPLYFQYAGQQQSFMSRTEILRSQLAQARFAVYGTSIPPDASFSPRIADGVVQGYEYNGTKAPPFTTFFGLYNHHFSYKDRPDWDLPDRWLTPPATFDRSTKLNLVSTNDITGGNSGSPLLNQDLEVVGLVFDGNIESLPNIYLYTDEAARTVSVDARGILEALDDIYDADRLVLELTTGQFLPTEADADAARGTR